MSTLEFHFVDFEDGTRCYLDESKTAQRGRRSDDAFWTAEQTGWLIDKFVKYMNDIGPNQKFRNKRSMWEHMAKEMYEETGDTKTFDQLQNRYKTLLRRKRNTLKQNKPLESILEATIPFPEEKGKHKTFSESNYDHFLVNDIQSQHSFDASSNKKNHTPTKHEPLSEAENDDGTISKKRKHDESSMKTDQSLSEVLKQTLFEIDRRRAKRENERERRRDIRHQETLELIRAIFCANSDYS